MYNVPYMWNVKRNDANELTERDTDFKNKLMVVREKG